MTDTTQKTNFVARTLFIVGGIILFIAMVVFIFKLIPMLISGIGGMFNVKTKSSETIAITTNVEVATTGTPLTISFDYKPTQAGQYFISYTCADGLYFDIQSSKGPKKIVCNVPFKLGSNVSTIALMPVVTEGDSLIDTTFTVEYKDSKEVVLDSGTKLISVTSDGANASTNSDEENPYNITGPLAGSTVTTSQPTTTTGYVPKYPAIVPAIPTGTTTTSAPKQTVAASRDFTVTNIYAIPNQSTFVMHVYNYGNTATGPWEFSYTDAENPSRTILSPIQGSLAGGQGIAVTVRFDGQVNSSQTVAVAINPNRTISESNYSNNSTSVVITGRSSGSNTNNNNNSYNSNEDADLIITSMEVGRMSGNKFIEDDSINEGDTAAVTFTVQNKGGESSGSWRFEATDLPYSSGDRTYRSSNQSSLRAGEYREILVEFEDADEGNYDIEVEVDSDDDVDEERENNNKRSQDLDVN